jgi:8-oxo-dGTP pyrophosphatase MutT (NUDIX family)
MDVNRTQTQHCTNCGLMGHVFRKCLLPVTSYGIIAIKYVADNHINSLFSKSNTISNGNDSIQFLLIQRKDSLSFVEFIRGKYNPADREYIKQLLRGMSQKEQALILNSTFDELWTSVWGETSSVKSHKTDYEDSEKKFSQIRDFLIESIHSDPSKWSEPEWGFPKGRRNPYEMDVSCAIREFQEETGLMRNEFTLFHNIMPISETFLGSNGIHYCHKYFIAVCNKETKVEMKIDNHHMAREIGNIKWCTLDEAITKIRPDNIEKREILLKASKIMRNFHPICTNDFPRILTNTNHHMLIKF